MSNNQTDLFIEDCKALACSIRVKFAAAAHCINLGLIQKHGASIVNQADASTWKYYQNICGQYHTTDTVMYINSLDIKGQRIAFTKTNLQAHPLTKEAYSYGSIYYKTLLQRFPEQEDIILGVLYPSDMQTAMDAKDGTILSYPSFLIKDYEYTFIEKLQRWLHAYFFRWVNPSYALYHNLYVADAFAKLTLQLLQQILLQRFQAIKSSEVHDYFIRAYFQSSQSIDKYIPYMTRSQQLFFYRNYAYMRKHAGSQSVFETLAKVLFFDRGMRLYSYDMKHVVTQMVSEDSAYPASLTPLVKFTRKQLLGSDLSVRDDSLFSLDNINAMLADQAKANEDELPLLAAEETKLLEYSASSRVKTKLLHCVAEDFSFISPRQFIPMAINHWLSYAFQNKYTASASVNLFFNNQTRYLTAKQAAILYVYCINKGLNLPVKGTQSFYARATVKLELPSALEVKSRMIPGKYTLGKIEALLSRFTVSQDNIQSVAEFYSLAKQLLAAIDYANRAIGFEEDIHSAACARMTHASVYEHRLCSYSVEYDSFLSKLNLDFTGLSASNFFEVAVSIANKFTGLTDYRGISIKQVQAAMIEMFKKMSSYSIALTSELWADDGVCTNPNAIRFTGYLMRRTQELWVKTDKINLDVVLTDTKRRSAINVSKDYSISSQGHSTAISKLVVSAISAYQTINDKGIPTIAIPAGPVRAEVVSSVSYVPTQEQLQAMAALK